MKRIYVELKNNQILNLDHYPVSDSILRLFDLAVRDGVLSLRLRTGDIYRIFTCEEIPVEPDDALDRTDPEELKFEEKWNLLQKNRSSNEKKALLAREIARYFFTHGWIRKADTWQDRALRLESSTLKNVIDYVFEDEEAGFLEEARLNRNKEQEAEASWQMKEIWKCQK